MTILDPVYKRDTAGKIRIWQAEFEGNKYRTTAGVKDGALVTSEWTVCTGKRGNTDEQQAEFEANAERNKKLKREYRASIAEIDNVMKGVMLADKYEKRAKDVAKAFNDGKMVFSQPKLDGIRAMITKDGAFTRELQPHNNCDHIIAILEPVFKEFPDFVLDGEFYNHELKDDFNKIVSVVRKSKPSAEDRAVAAKLVQYHVYDAAVPGLDFYGRNKLLFATVFQERFMPIIVPVVTHRPANQAELDQHQAAYIADGYEGQMVRLNAPYEFDTRSKALLKRKEFITEEFPFLRVEEGQGNWSGCAKRVIYRMLDGGDGEAGMRGTQDFARELLTTSKTWGPDASVTIRHFGLTPDGAHRFPVAIDFHPDGRRD